MKETGTRTTLSCERLGDEKRIQEVLAGWGVDAQAVERMLDQHRALRAQAREARPRPALRNHPASGRPNDSPGAHSTR